MAISVGLQKKALHSIFSSASNNNVPTSSLWGLLSKDPLKALLPNTYFGSFPFRVTPHYFNQHFCFVREMSSSCKLHPQLAQYHLVPPKQSSGLWNQGTCLFFFFCYYPSLTLGSFQRWKTRVNKREGCSGFGHSHLNIRMKYSSLYISLLLRKYYAII